MAFAEGRDTDIVYRDGMRGMWHGMPEWKECGKECPQNTERRNWREPSMNQQ